jgi:hypothetical protein
LEASGRPPPRVDSSFRGMSNCPRGQLKLGLQGGSAAIPKLEVRPLSPGRGCLSLGCRPRARGAERSRRTVDRDVGTARSPLCGLTLWTVLEWRGPGSRGPCLIELGPGRGVPCSREAGPGPPALPTALKKRARTRKIVSVWTACLPTLPACRKRKSRGNRLFTGPAACDFVSSCLYYRLSSYRATELPSYRSIALPQPPSYSTRLPTQNPYGRVGDPFTYVNAVWIKSLASSSCR